MPSYVCVCMCAHTRVLSKFITLTLNIVHIHVSHTFNNTAKFGNEFCVIVTVWCCIDLPIKCAALNGCVFVISVSR